MKKIILIALIIFFVPLFAKSQIWSEVKQAEIADFSTGYSANEIITDVVKDVNGNYYITGYYDGRMVFGSDTINSYDGYDIFVAKADKNRNWLWVETAYGKSADYSMSISLDPSGNAFITGFFNDDLVFGSTTLNASNKDLFVAKISSDGVWQWAKKAGSSNGDEAYSIKTDSDGNSYVCGRFSSTATFGSYTVTSKGAFDIFISKINTSGTWQWVKRAGGTLKDNASSIDLDSKNIYICGYFSGTSDFGSTTITSKGSYDIFTAKINKNGDWQWVKKVGGTGTDVAEAICYNSGKLYYTGSFSGDADFSTDTVSSQGLTDAFLAVIDTSGVYSWVRTAGGTKDDCGYDVFIYSSNIYFSGTFVEYAQFNGTSYASNGGNDIFIASYSASGNFNSVSTGGSEGNDKLAGTIEISTGLLYNIGYGEGLIKFGTKSVSTIQKLDAFEAIQYAAGSWKSINLIPSAIYKSEVKSVVCDNSGNKYFTGYYYGKIKFGTIELSSVGGSDIFIAKSNYDGSWAWAKTAGGSNDDVAYDIVNSSTGDLYVVGSFNTTADFGSINVNSKGIDDAFISKLNSSGDYTWVKTAGGIDYDVARAVKINSKGDIFVAGNFLDSAYFGSIKATSAGLDDAYIAKINSSGNWQWIKTAGGEENEAVYDLFIDKEDKLYICGSLFNGGYFGSILVMVKGADDAFIAKADTNGTWLKAVSCGSEGFNEKAYSLFVDDSLNCYVVGQFTGLGYFGSLFLMSDASISGFMAKLNSAFTFTKAEKYGTTGENKLFSINKDNNRFYIGGQFEGSINYATKTYTSNGKKDFIVFAKDLNFNDLYAFKGGGAGNDLINSIAPFTDGEVFFAGTFASKTYFGDYSISTPSSYDNMAFIGRNDYIPNPPAWDLPTLTDNFSTINIPKAIAPKVNNRAFEKGDAVGVFYKIGKTMYCAGYTIYMKNDISIKVRGDNLSTTQKDGIGEFDKYYFKLWDGKEQKEMPGYVNIKTGPRRYKKSAVTEIENLPMKPDTIEIQLTKGWNLMSSYIDPKNSLADSVFKGLTNLVVAKNVSGNYYLKSGSTVINTIGDYDERAGYSIYMSGDEKIKIIGDRINSIYDPIKLVTGWNLMGVSTDDDMNIDTLFNNIRANITIVKNSIGKFYIPFGYKNLFYINPKQGYKVYMKNESILYFPDN